MSDGDIGPGMSYCATIRISGDLDKTKLQAVIAEIAFFKYRRLLPILAIGT